MAHHFFILKKDVAKEKSDGYVLTGEIMMAPSNMEQPGQAGKMRLTFPPGRGKGTVLCLLSDAYPLHPEDADLLMGIDACFDRWQYFSRPEELDESLNLQKGTAVTFQYDKAYTWFSAVILFRGRIPALGPGVRFGLEILVCRSITGCTLLSVYTPSPLTGSFRVLTPRLGIVMGCWHILPWLPIHGHWLALKNVIYSMAIMHHTQAQWCFCLQMCFDCNRGAQIGKGAVYMYMYIVCIHATQVRCATDLSRWSSI